jgi:hypothetical protein
LFAKGMKELGWELFKAAMERVEVLKGTKARLRQWERKQAK